MYNPGRPPFLGVFTQVEIDAINAEIAGGTMKYAFGSTLLNGDTGTLVTLLGTPGAMSFDTALSLQKGDARYLPIPAVSNAAQAALASAQLFDSNGNARRLTMQAQQFLGSANSQFFTVPDGVTVIEMEGTASGGGGGGGFGGGTGGGGGGGSGGQTLYRKMFIVSPAETLTINVPFAGIGGALSGNGGRPVPDGPSGSLLTVVGSVSGQMIALTSGGPGRGGTGSLGGQGGDASGSRFNTGIAAPAAGTAGTPGTDFQTENANYGNCGGMGGTGCISTGAAISGGRGGRASNIVSGGQGGSSGAVANQGGGGGGGTGFPDGNTGNMESGGNGGADAVAGQAGKTFGAGGGGGGRNAVGGAGGQGMLRIFY